MWGKGTGGTTEDSGNKDGTGRASHIWEQHSVWLG